MRREAGPFVLKPLFGSQGRGLRLVRGEQDLPDSAEVSGVYYLQRFVGVERNSFRDFRVLVSSGRVVAAMMRQSSHWVTNVKRGGKPVAAVADATMEILPLPQPLSWVPILQASIWSTIRTVASPCSKSTACQRGRDCSEPRRSTSLPRLRATWSRACDCRCSDMSELARKWPHQIASAFEYACRDELDAPKPGNVHVFANGGRLDVKDFGGAAQLPLRALSHRPRTKGGGKNSRRRRRDCRSGRNKHKSRYYFTVRASRGSGGTFSYDLRSSLSQALRTLDWVMPSLPLKPLYVHRQRAWEGQSATTYLRPLQEHSARPWPRRRTVIKSPDSM